MAPLECWYDTEESVNPWKISGTFGGGEWTSEPVEQMDAGHRQSSWIPTSDGRKRFHRDLPIKTSSATVPMERIVNMTGGPPLQYFITPLTGGWNDQTLADVLHVSTAQPPEVKDHHVANHSERVTRSQDVDSVIVDRPSKIYTENYVSNFAASVLLTDESNNEGGNISRHKLTSEVANGFGLMNGWNPRRRITDHLNEKVLRNQETLFAAETSNGNGQNFWSTPFCTPSSDTVGSLPSARSVSSEGRQSEIEVKMEQNSLGDVPNLIPDRNGHMQGIREAVSSLGGHGVQTAEINRVKAVHEQSKLSELSRLSACFDTKCTFVPSINFLDDTGQSSRLLPETGMLTTVTQNSQIPFHDGNGLSNFSGRSVETLSPPLPVAVFRSPRAALFASADSFSFKYAFPGYNCNVLGGSSQSSQVPHFPLHLTPPLQHPPQLKEQMVGVQQSFTISPQNQNRCSSPSPAFQGHLQSKLVSETGPGRVQQMQNSSWQEVMNGLEHGAVDKQLQLSLPHGSPLDVDIHGVGSGESGSIPDWTSSEALVIQQLQATMLQLDVGTRMCIRDALYRLAKSAKERKNCRAHYINQDLAEPDRATISSCITGEGPCDGSRCESETQTNYLDRSIASLLFNTGPFWKYGQPAAYKVRSVSQPLPGVQNGSWLWSSTGMMGHNWSSSACDQADQLEGAPRLPLCNPLNSTWAASPSVNGFRASNPTAIDSRLDHVNFMRTDKSRSLDNYQPSDTQADRLNMPLSSSMSRAPLFQPMVPSPLTDQPPLVSLQRFLKV